MSEFIILYSDFFMGIGITIFALLIPLGFFIARSLRKANTNQVYWKICGSVGLITFIGASSIGLGIYLEPLRNVSVDKIEYGSYVFLLSVVICPGIFAVISSIIVAIAIWSEHVKQLADQERQEH